MGGGGGGGGGGEKRKESSSGMSHSLELGASVISAYSMQRFL